MNKNHIWIVGALIVCLTGIRTVAAASKMDCEAFQGSSKSPLMSDFDCGIRSSWSSSRKSPSELGTSISFCIGDDGKIYEPSIQTSSSDSQFDAECLEAVCSLSPLAKFNNGTGDLQHIFIQLGRKSAPVPIEPTFAGAETLNFINSLNNKNAHFVVVHKIPLSVLTRYPGMFSNGELQSEKNLIAFRFDNDAKPPEFVKKISDFYAQWGELFSNSLLTKEQILNRAKNISSDTRI